MKLSLDKISGWVETYLQKKMLNILLPWVTMSLMLKPIPTHLLGICLYKDSLRMSEEIGLQLLLPPPKKEVKRKVIRLLKVVKEKKNKIKTKRSSKANTPLLTNQQIWLKNKSKKRLSLSTS